MPVEDKNKNKGYVAKYRDNKKKDEETKTEYNKVNASYIADHRKKLKEILGKEEYNRRNAEYMKKKRAEQKQLKENNKIGKVSILQNAFRNKIARNQFLKQKQIKANEIISNINNERKVNDVNQLVQKLNAITMSNDILNDLFPNALNYLSKTPTKRGRPRLTEEQKRHNEELRKEKRGNRNKPKN